MASNTGTQTAAGKISARENTANITAREQIVTVPANSLLDLEFENTMPNYVYINNYSGNMIYFGRSVLPSTTVYDMTVDGYGDNLYASPNSFYKAYLYNGSGSDSQVKVTSFVAPFEAAALKGGGAAAASQAPATNVNSTIQSFNTPLPTGANVIGHVVVDAMPDQTISQSLQTGANHIGSVAIDGGLPPLATGSSHIGTVGIDGGITISSMPPVQVSSQPVATNHYYFEHAAIAQTTVTFTFGGGNHITDIHFIINDGTGDVLIDFDATDPSIVGNQAANSGGQNFAIRLKAGESISELGRQCTSVSFYAPTGTQAVRFLGA